jgi:membrane-bound lytic murein transglycosylase
LAEALEEVVDWAEVLEEASSSLLMKNNFYIFFKVVK